MIQVLEQSTITAGMLMSMKGFVIDERKISCYCLKPDGAHSGEFFACGYTADDIQRLFSDIEAGFDLRKKCDELPDQSGLCKYSIPMILGPNEPHLFRTVWKNDGPGGMARFITAYIDRRLGDGLYAV